MTEFSYVHADPGGDTDARVGARAHADFTESGAMAVREATDDDIPFLAKSWLNSYRGNVPFVGNDVYYVNHHALLERLWDDPGVTWLVACSAKYPTYIFGFLCAEASDKGPIVHYVYVRHEASRGLPLRKRGIATKLLETFFEGQDTSTVWYTHSTPNARMALQGRHKPQPGNDGWEYNPYLLYRRLLG